MGRPSGGDRRKADKHICSLLPWLPPGSQSQRLYTKWGRRAAGRAESVRRGTPGKTRTDHRDEFGLADDAAVAPRRPLRRLTAVGAAGVPTARGRTVGVWVAEGATEGRDRLARPAPQPPGSARVAESEAGGWARLGTTKPAARALLNRPMPCVMSRPDRLLRHPCEGSAAPGRGQSSSVGRLRIRW